MRAKSGSKVRWRSAVMLVVCLGGVSVAHVVAVARGGWSEVLHGTGAASEEISRVSSDGQHVVAEGRVVTYPGEELTLSAEAAGRIVRLDVQEKQAVQKGDLIAELDSDELKASLEESRARVDEAGAELRLAETKLAQVSQLTPRAISTVDLLERKRDVEICKARFAQSNAVVSRVEAELNKTRILAPIDGAVIRRSTDPGQMVQLASPVVAIANLKHLRVEAEVNEFDGARLALGAAVVITAEGYPSVRWQGEVEEIPDLITSRRLMPQDPGRPTDTGIMLVKVRLLEPTPLKLGQRVEITIR